MPLLNRHRNDRVIGTKSDASYGTKERRVNHRPTTQTYAQHAQACLALACALVAACGDGPAPAPACSPERTSAVASGITRRALVSSGVDREYFLYVPDSWDGRQSLALVLSLHSSPSSAGEHAALSDLRTLAETEGFAVAELQSARPLAWNEPVEAGRPDDVLYASDVIDDVGRALCLDTRRVFATGFSGGGRMASRLACDLSDRIAAIAPVAGLRHGEPCTPHRPVPVVTFHGTADVINPFEGDDRGQRWGESVAEAVAGWAHANSCRGPPETQSVSDEVERRSYRECADGAEVEFYVIAGGGHTWPGSPIPSPLGYVTQDISASEIAWRFFVRHPMP